MARLINNIADLKTHIVVASTFDFTKVLPYAKRAERKIIVGLIGRDQYDALVIHTLNETANTPVDQVKSLFQEAAAHYAMFLAMPTLNLLVTNAGTQKTNLTEASPADWKDKLDLNRSLLQTYNEALDEAFQIMEDNVDDFPDWKNSEYYTVFKNLVVSQTRIFNRHFEIQNRRSTFNALKPLQSEVEDQYLLPMLGAETLALLKTKSTNEFVIKAQEEAVKASVALTVAKAAETGTFVFTDTYLGTVTELQPWESRQLLSDDARCDLRKSRQNAGEQYLKALKKVVVANPTVFTAYVDKAETGISGKVIANKSGLWL